MYIQNLTEEKRLNLINFIKEKSKNKFNVDISDIYIYGSRIYNTFHDNSDIDCSVISDHVYLPLKWDNLRLNVISTNNYNTLLNYNPVIGIEKIGNNFRSIRSEISYPFPIYNLITKEFIKPSNINKFLEYFDNHKNLEQYQKDNLQEFINYIENKPDRFVWGE